MATRSFKLRLHVLGSKLHKWLAVFVGVQVLLWMITGALMSFLNIEEVRSEHVVSRAPEVLPADAVLPQWLESREGVVSLATRAVGGRAVTEVRWVCPSKEEEGTVQMGLKFVDLDDTARRRLLAFVKSLVEEEYGERILKEYSDREK